VTAVAVQGIVNDVFKFLALRPPVAKRHKVVKDDRDPADTPIGRLVGQGDVAQAAAVVRNHVEGHRWSVDPAEDEEIADAAIAGDAIAAWVADPGERSLAQAIEDALGASPADLAQRGRLAELTAATWDRVYAFYVLTRVEAPNIERLLAAVRALDVVAAVAAGESIEEPAGVGERLTATVAIPAMLVDLMPSTGGRDPRVRERDARLEARKQDLAALWDRYVALERTASELANLRPEIEVVKDEPAGEPPPLEDRDAPRRGRPLIATTTERRPVFRAAALDALGAGARRALALQPGADAARRGEHALNATYSALAAAGDELLTAPEGQLLLATMPAEAEQLPVAMAVTKQYSASELLPDLSAAAHTTPISWLKTPGVRPLGIGDLKVVKQKLLRYVAGEVAHIENVLLGEDKERVHRRLDRREETITVAVETTEETERDTQTTDRFELKKEAESTIQTDMSVDAGVNVSASYGPVEVGAHANFAYSQSQTDTTRSSQNFAREVVDRSVTRVQRKAREERVTKMLHEIEETNRHGLNNVGGSGHVTGVYRWVDKEYEAQIFNYGKRMMFEFVVPEPAAYYRWAQENDPSKQVDIPKPPALPAITHQSITEATYQTFIRDYNVQGVTPPPPPSKVVGLALDQSGMADDQSSSKASKELVIPDGYVATTFWYQFGVWQGSQPYFKLSVGGDSSENLSSEDSVIPVALVTQDVRAYAGVVEVWCERTARAYEDWQIKTYEKIRTAHKAAMAEYEDKVAAAEARRGVVIKGQNPAINREIERRELKKLSLRMLTGTTYSEFDAMSGAPPHFSLTEAASEGKFVQFFEQAFEWEQVTYLFYPYFWGRKEEWPKTSNLYDNDPLFTQFLQAGSARVVVPVRPAYNDAILYYLQTGAIWNGGEAPQLDDPLYVAIHEELKAQQDDLGNAVPEGDPWRVVLPTTLVWLQPGPELPDYTV
jgi:hypothetical protein